MTVVSIDAARRLASVTAAKDVEGAQWAFADALVQDVPPDPNETRVSFQKRGVRNGEYSALSLLAEELANEGLAYSVGSLRQYRATALAWPEDIRVKKGAGFTVHRELRGKEDRVAILDRLMIEHGGRVTQKQVRTWKAEQKQAKFESWGDAMRRKARGFAKQARSTEARAELADILEAVARELRGG